MNGLNAIVGNITAAMLAPFAALPAWVGLVVLSLLAGAFAGVIYRFTSNQAALKRVAGEVSASLLAMRIYNEDFVVALRSQGRLLKASGLRIWYSLPPVVVLIVPFGIALGHLAMWYEFRPLKPGDAVLVKLTARGESWDAVKDVPLAAPDGFTVESRVRDINNKTVTWRLRADTATPAGKPATLSWGIGGQKIDKQVVVSADMGALQFVSPRRPTPSIWDILLYPGEPAFDATSPVQSIDVGYPSRAAPWMGIAPPWLVIFFVVSIVGAMLLMPFMKVQF